MFSKNFYNVIQNHDVLSTYLINVEVSLRLVWRREKIKYKNKVPKDNRYSKREIEVGSQNSSGWRSRKSFYGTF